MDILITLNTSFFVKGSLINKRLEILKNYSKNELILDLITFMPLTYCLMRKKFSYFKLLVLLIIFKLFKHEKKMEDYLRFSEKQQGLFKKFIYKYN